MAEQADPLHRSFAPGGTTDILARTIGEKLGAALGQPIVVENKPGQGGSIGAAELARAAPDGYTIGGGTISSHAINATLYDKLSYDPITSFAPITMYATQPNVLLVHPERAGEKRDELIALLKANPNKYAFGSAGNGTSQHISGELFKVMAGVTCSTSLSRQRPDDAGAAGRHAAGGIRQHRDCSPARERRQAARAGGDKRDTLDRVARRADDGRIRASGYDISSWQAVFAPAGTPAPIVERLYTEIARILKTPDIQKRLSDLGLNVSEMTPAQLTALIKTDVPRLGKIVKDTGAQSRLR